MTTTCNYCGQPAEIVSGREIYPQRRDLWLKWFWNCKPCGARVGCHPGTKRPLGRLANAELRAAKQAAHAAFDPLWKSGDMTRSEAYRWLGGMMGIAEPHIGEFTVQQCERCVAACGMFALDRIEMLSSESEDYEFYDSNFGDQ